MSLRSPRLASLLAVALWVAPACGPSSTSPSSGDAGGGAPDGGSGGGPDDGPTTPITDFYSSFEATDPQPTWTSTVETDATGQKLTSGVTGSPNVGIPGNIMDQVVEVKASGENPPGEAATGVADGDVNTKWLVFTGTGWVQLKLQQPVAVKRYAVTSANDAPERDPASWALEGSQDGQGWTAVDTQSNQSFDARHQAKQYDFSNSTAYLYYRLNITQSHGAAMLQIAELQLSRGDDGPQTETDMKSVVGDGPSSSWNAKVRAGFTGARALRYAGAVPGAGRGYSVNKVFDVDVPVTAASELSYLIFVDASADDLTASGSYAAVDLAFDDGTYLSGLGAVDQHSAPLTAQGQGESRTLYPGEWNRKVAKIGEVAAGKTIKRILIGYDNPKGSTASFGGWIDDLRIVRTPAVRALAHLSDYVLTTRGTNSSSSYSRGNNFPATAVPHGFNFWTPVTDAGSGSWLYTYHRSNNADNLPTLQALSLSHEPSPWMGDRQSFQVMPSSAAGTPDADRAGRSLAFKHEDEVARPYYYGVSFVNGMKAEIAPTDHAALFRFTFTGDDANLIFDNVNNKGKLILDAQGGVVTGFSDTKSGLSTGATRLFVYATFDKPVTASGALPGGGGADVTGYLRFSVSAADRTVTMRIATSLISVEQAKKNLALEIAPADTFEVIEAKAQKLWDDTLGIIEVEGATPDQLTTLYSNLYRLFLYPNSGFENTGTAEAPFFKYASPVGPPTGANTDTQTGAKVVAGKVYVNNGFWDTYRAPWPAYTLLTPTQAGVMIDGFVQQFKDGGWVSRWSSPGYADLMNGTSSDVAFADAYVKGVTNFDIAAAYDAALKNATVKPTDGNVGRKGLETSIFRGYTSTDTGAGFSWAMAGYLNDFGIANMAAALAEDVNNPRHQEYVENAEYFLSRAQSYVNLFDPSIQFFQGRDASGAFRSHSGDYDPRNWWGDYTETNGWNMAFDAPYDGQGLVNLYGGKEQLVAKLDTFFSTPETGGNGTIHEMREARDVRMGQLGMSNQPSFHILYMYDYTGQPFKTQEKVRDALQRLWVGSEIGQGYIGDEDNGAMSAWQIFSALGFYPLQVGSPNYVIGSPLFTKATVHLENGKQIVINAPENNAKNVYVQQLKVNGQPYSKTYLPHSVLAAGATLDIHDGVGTVGLGYGSAGCPAVDHARDGRSCAAA